MLPSEIVKPLLSNSVYTSYAEQVPAHYLTHLFSKLDKSLNVGEWEVGFYDKDTKKITVFTLGDVITQQPADDIFRESGHPQELKLDEVKTEWETVKQTVDELQKTSYPAQIPQSGLVILQRFEDKLMWNVTLVTIAFAALNVKVDAATGEVLEHKKTSFFDLRQN